MCFINRCHHLQQIPWGFQVNLQTTAAVPSTSTSRTAGSFHCSRSGRLIPQMVFYGHTRNTFTGSANNTLCYRYKTTECARHSTNPNRKEEIKIETDRVFKRTQKCIDNMVFVGTWRRYWPQGIGNLSGFWSNSGISTAGSELRRITTNCARHG